MAELVPQQIPCPVCGESIPLPGSLVVDYDIKGQILVDLGPSRAHADEQQHPEILPAALAKFGIPWYPSAP